MLRPLVLKILTSLSWRIFAHVFQFGSNKVETESESTTLLSEKAVKIIVKPSVYEHRSITLMIYLTCRLDKKWVCCPVCGSCRMTSDVKTAKGSNTGVFKPIRPDGKTNFSKKKYQRRDAQKKTGLT